MTPLQAWVRKRGYGALSHIYQTLIRDGSSLSWSALNRAHQRGGVQLRTARQISKVCKMLGGAAVPFVSMLEACDPPPPKSKPEPNQDPDAPRAAEVT